MNVEELYIIIQTWIPSVTTTSTLAFLLFLFKTSLKSSIEGAVLHKFNTRIEEVKSELKREEESYKASLKSKDDEIFALRGGALSGLSFRQNELAMRRISAVEAIWKCVVDLSPIKGVSSLIATLKISNILDKAEQKNEEGRSLREFGEIIFKSYSMEESVKSSKNAEPHRLFVNDITWALFAGYRQILIFNTLIITAIKGGLGKDAISNNQFIIEILKSSLPHHAKYIDEHGILSMHQLVDEFESKVFIALKLAVENNDMDNTTVSQASSILESVAKIADARQAALIPQVSSLELG